MELLEQPVGSTSCFERTPLLRPGRRRTHFAYTANDTWETMGNIELPFSFLSRPFLCILVAKFLLSFAVNYFDSHIIILATDKNQLNMTAGEAKLVEWISDGGWLTFSFIVGLLVAFVGGKFIVIFCGSIVFLAGSILVLLCSISRDMSADPQWATNPVMTRPSFKFAAYIGGYFLVYFGCSCSLFNMYAFAADQIPGRGPTGIRAVILWVNFCSCFGVFPALIVGKSVSIFYGNLFSVCAILIGVIIFRAGKGRYLMLLPSKDEMCSFLKLIKEAIKKRFHRTVPLDVYYIHHWLDRARKCVGGSHKNWDVEDVKDFCRLLSFFPTILFTGICFNEASNMMEFQGRFMNMKLMSSISLPSGRGFEIIFILVLIPFVTKVAFPYLAKKNINWSPLQRIGISMVAMVAALIIAGLIDFRRVRHCCTVQERDGQPTHVSWSTIFYQVPQYILLSVGYIFFVPTAFEFFYIESPKSLQTVAFGCVATLLGGIIGAQSILKPVVNAIARISGKKNKWYPDEEHINDVGDQFASLFFVVAALLFLNFIYYIFVARRFKRNKKAAKEYHAFYRNVSARLPRSIVRIPPGFK